MNYSKLLLEADKANINYPDLIKPTVLWRIKNSDTGYSRYTASSVYLSFSFVMDKNLKFPELGFNLMKNYSLNQRPLCFLTEEDAKQFYDIYKDKAPDLKIDQLSVGKGRGGIELVRISKDGSIPVYGLKSSVEYLLNYPDNKVPEYVKKRLDGNVLISDEQKAKDAKKQKAKDKQKVFIDNYFSALRELTGIAKIIDEPKVETDPDFILSLGPRKNPLITAIFNAVLSNGLAQIYVDMMFNLKKGVSIARIVISNDYLFDNSVINVFNSMNNDYSLPVRITVDNEPPINRILYYKKCDNITSDLNKDEIKNILNNYIKDLIKCLNDLSDEEVI